MASYTLRVYWVNKYNVGTTDRLRVLLNSSVDISIKRVSGTDVFLQTYTYDENTDSLRILHSPVRLEDPTVDIITVQLLFDLTKQEVIRDIFVSTKSSFPFYMEIDRKEVLDWPKMITDLYLANKVVIMESKSVMAVDKRRFYFIGDSMDTSVDVDFLGTALAQGENERVIEAWRMIA